MLIQIGFFSFFDKEKEDNSDWFLGGNHLNVMFWDVNCVRKYANFSLQCGKL